ncbi:MAG: DUF2252 domain-containing protein [Candidatus Polarisedimenticolia bacterium]
MKTQAKERLRAVGTNRDSKAPSVAPLRPRAERRAEGRALRDSVPREEHSGWKPPKDRRDPVEIVLAANEGRLQELLPIRHGRMSRSPFAFYRGSAAIMAADLAHTPSSGLRVQACGDAHLSNFGVFATPERGVIFDVNDLDETLPAPWEWDLKRLTASVVLAGRHIQLKQTESARAARAAVRSYREHIAEYSFMKALDIWYDRIDIQRLVDSVPDEKERARMETTLEKARARTAAEHDFPKLAEYDGSTPRIKDNPPLIFHHPLLKKYEGSKEIKAAWAFYRESLPEQIRVLFDRFHLCDMALKVVGVGSVGTACLVALYMAADDDPLFLQIKQANASVLEPHAGRSLHGNHGQRVVVGQRLMQAASDIFLGWTQGHLGRHFYVRQLRDMKISADVESMDAQLLRQYADACAWALAQAHARSGDAAMISGYMGSGRTFDEAICDFAGDYADQAERDHKAFVKAIREKRVKAVIES